MAEWDKGVINTEIFQVIDSDEHLTKDSSCIDCNIGFIFHL